MTNSTQVLYIDDDEDDQELFHMAINEISGSIDCIGAIDPREAFRKLTAKEWLPDMIFLDLNMPVMTGQEFLKEAKTHNELKNIPVIILSTSSQPTTIQMLKEMGAEGFITKPRTYPELVTKLQSMLIT